MSRCTKRSCSSRCQLHLASPRLTSPRLLHQELRCREEELKQAALEQKSHEEFLRQREQQLAQWEQDVFERELSLLILHLNQNQEKPNVKKRKGTFKKHKLKSKNGEKISMPQGAFNLQIKRNTIFIFFSPRAGKGSEENKFYDATAGSNSLCALPSLCTRTVSGINLRYIRRELEKKIHL